MGQLAVGPFPRGRCRENKVGGLIPLTDASRRPMHFPFVTTGIILANFFVFILELKGGDAFVLKWSAVPANIIGGHHWITLFTAMFLHGSWSHILGNMIFLWAFGPEIEDAMNPLRYLAFYILGGLVAMLAQVAVMPSSTVPNLGASGAIAAVMGAFLVTYPRDRIKSLLIIFVFVRITMIPAALLIGVWFLMQLVNVGSVAAVQGGGVAYIAHVAGVIFGVVTARLFEDRARLAN
jgi:membrane associated rhomboid family serine protease